jgi:hypothetical protein
LRSLYDLAAFQLEIAFTKELVWRLLWRVRGNR